ncbi:hypothetical protein H6F44_10495 [Pseudanabaena sp. FACHB-1277]|uniref:PIN-like domain-containing protein n=1 Tax=Pseudanabaena cinerea FACHB-1277 TaxID=2949581 RepID=A0A926Z6C2_9CYAN|nr:PIN domain-containing protein [Pseudanabaena cinerea]MBD2150545.1 hypothetical protein [Pseudanabaena cinerea FACHB-1277]
MRNNYVMVDYENVQNIDLNCLKDKNFYIKIFIGTNQTKIPIDLVLKSQELSGQVEWIQINGSGKNALDFHITFMLGRLTERDPTAVFHIISKDTGFDPLVSYLKSQKLLCKRSDDLSLITSLIWDEKLSLEDTCNIIIQKLILNDKSRPRSETTLKNYIKSHLGLKEALPVIDEVYQKLFDIKKIKLNSAKKIEYNF